MKSNHLIRITDHIIPVKILTASCCNFSRVLVIWCVQPSKTKDEYSSIGNKCEIYIWLQAILLRLYFNFLITPIILATLLTTVD